MGLPPMESASFVSDEWSRLPEINDSETSDAQPGVAMSIERREV